MTELPVVATQKKTCIDAVKVILSVIQLAAKEIRRLLTHRTLEDIQVLETMLQRVFKSSSPNMHEKFANHGIPDRLNYVANKLTDSHGHRHFTKYGPERLTIFECVRNKGFWKQTSPGGIFSFPIIFGWTDHRRKCQHDRMEHIKETESDLKFCVEEIESIYDQTNSLLLANMAETNSY